MKAALSLLIFGLVAASALQVKNVQPYEFTPGKMYVYDYSAQLLTGIPKITDQFSGLKLKAQITFQAKGSSSEQVAMKLTKIKISQAQDLKNVQNGLNIESQNSGEEELAQRWIKEYIRELGKAITFTHVNGQVVNFVADKSEPEWSLNIKKSILTLFHLNLEPKQVMRSTETNEIPKPVSHEDLTYYGVYESGMTGICESVYELDQIPDLRSVEPKRELVLNVTKTKNYHNCLTKATLGMKDNLSARHSQHFSPSFEKAVRGYYPVPTQETPRFQPNTPVKQYTTTKYNISLTHSAAQIEGIWCEGKIVYTTFGDNIMAYTHQRVTLVRVAPVQQASLGSISNPEMHEELSYQLPKMNELYSQIVMDIPHMALFTQQKTSELTEALPKLFESLARAVLESGKTSHQTTNKDAMQKVVQTVNALSVLPEEQLQGMYRAIAQAGLEKNAIPKHQLMRKMFLDALALSGSNEAARLIAKLILNREVTSHEAREMLATLPRSMNFPTRKTLDTYLELLQNPQIVADQWMQPSVAVAFGKMVNTAFAKSSRIQGTRVSKERVEKTFADESVHELVENENKNNQWRKELRDAAPKKEDLERYVVVVSRLLEQADNFNKKVAAIECLAHMGAKEVLPALEPYVTGSGSIEIVPGYEVEDPKELIKERNFLRTIAIYSLAHVARRNSRQVLPLVLPVYRNTAEPHEMRLAAFTIAMLCKPEQHILESIASDLHRESNKHVTSFVVSALKSIGNLTTPCQKSLAHAAAEAVESVPQEQQEQQQQQQQQNRFKYSTYLSRDFYDEKRSFGMWAATEWINSRRSPIPRAGYVAVSQISSPFHDELLEIGFEAKGLEKIAKRIVGSNGLIASLLENKRQKSEETPRLQSRKNEKQESPKLNLFVKMFEQTTIYPLDESMIKEAIEQVEQWAREAIAEGFTGTFVKVLMPSSISKVAASEIGLPVVVAHKHPLIVSLKVDKLNVEKKTHSNGQYKGFAVSAEIEPKIMYSSYAFVYAIEPVQKTTVGTHIEKTYQASLPLSLKLTHDHQEQKWSFVAKPKSGHEAVYHKSEAKTFLSKARIVLPASQDWLQSAQTIRRMNSSPVKVEKTISHKQIPVAAKVIVEAEEAELDRRAIQKQISKHGLVATLIKIFRNSGLNSREVRVRIEENPEAEKREIRLQWTMDESNIPEDSDDSSESEEEKQEQEQLRQQLRRRQGQNDEESFYAQEEYERVAQRDSFLEEIFSRIGSAVTGQKVHYPKESERKIRKQAQKWYLQARKSLQWIDDEEKQLTPEQQQEQEDEEEQYNYRHKYYQVHGLNKGQEQNANQFMRTEYIIRGNKVCFTTRPVMACGNNAEPATTMHVTMDFHCLPRSSPLTQQLMKDAQTSIIRQLANKRVDYREELTVPQSCSA